MNRRFFATILVIAVIALCLSTAEAANVTIRVLDVGQGDAILITLPTGKSVLVDGSEIKYGRNVIVPTLKRLGITELEKVILTHPHSDHLGGLIPVLENISVKEVWDTTSYTTMTYKKFRKIIRENNIPRREVFRGETETWGGGVTVSVLNPKKRVPGEPLDFPVIEGNPDLEDDELRSAVNNSSIVFRLTFGNTSILLTGDAEKSAEREMLANGLTLRAQVLKAGHHGSSTSTSNDFLYAVKPEIAVISLGEDNNYGHPASTTLNKLERIKAAVYQTDLLGTIVLNSDGSGFTVQSENREIEYLLDRIGSGEQGLEEKVSTIISHSVRTGYLRKVDLFITYCEAHRNVVKRYTVILKDLATALRVAHLEIQPASDLENPFLPRLKKIERLLR